MDGDSLRLQTAQNGEVAIPGYPVTMEFMGTVPYPEADDFRAPGSVPIVGSDISRETTF